MSDENNNPTENTPQQFWQKNWFKNVMTVVLFIAIYLAIRPFMQGDVIEGKAPVMQVESITGQKIDLQQMLDNGEPVLIHIWATWCPICEVTKDFVEGVSEDYQVINIATQSADDDQLLDYAKQHNMNADIIVNDFSGEWLRTFGAKAVPADFIIAPNGEIAFVEVGFTSAWGLRIRLWWASL